MNNIVNIRNINNSTLSNSKIATVEHSEIMSVKMLNRFYEFLDVSSITLRSYRSGIKQFMAYLNSQNERKPNREAVIMFKKALIDKGAKPATVALYLSALRRFFDWCETEGLYENITRGVKSPKQDKGHKKDALSGTQLKDIVQSMRRTDEQGKRDYAMFLLMATGGLRTVEITRANIGDIRVVMGIPCLFVWGKGRNGDKKEFIKLTPEVHQAISEYLKTRSNVSEEEPLFASCSRRNRGGRLTTRTVSSVAKGAMVRAGYDSTRLTAHSLRHSAATLALQAGMSLPDVQSFMRHSSINVTMIYNHALNRMNSQCESAITGAIFGHR